MKLTITQDREILRADERGILTVYRQISYTLDDKGPYLYTVKAAEWDIEKFKAEVKKKAEELQALETMPL